MKTIKYKNIELLRVSIKSGETDYYFPQNVSWAGCKIDKIVACLPKNACVDPYDGVTPVMTKADAGDLFFNIYSKDQKELLHAVSAEQIWHKNNNPLLLNSELDLSLCNLYFTSAPAQDMTLLLYVFHDTAVAEDELPENSVSAEFELQAGEEINFQQIITTYIRAIPAKVKGMLFWNAETAPAYFTLRNYEQTYMLQNLHSELARVNMNGGSAEDSQVAPMLFDNININFQYSHIRNCGASAAVQKITILY